MRLHRCNYNISHSKLMWKSDSKWQKVKSLLALFKKTHTTRFICVKSSRQGLCCWMTLAQSEMESYKQDQNKATRDHWPRTWLTFQSLQGVGLFMRRSWSPCGAIVTQQVGYFCKMTNNIMLAESIGRNIKSF